MAVTDRTTAPSRALDPKTLDYERDATTKRLRRRHWVDDAMWTICRTRKGSVRSAPHIGHTVGEIKYIDERVTGAQVFDRVTIAAADLLARKLVRIDSVDVDLSTAGAIFYQVNYTNLVTAKPDRVAVSP